MVMSGLSRTWVFGVATAVSVSAVSLLAWRVIDSNPRLFSRTSAPSSALSQQASPPLAPPAAPEAARPAGGATMANIPKFDVVRIEPNGDAVVAGRAAPGASINLLDNGLVVARVKADENGQFAIVPPALKQGDHLLTLQVEGHATPADAQTVAVALPTPGKGEVVVALVEPGQATKMLNEPAPAAQAEKTALAIRSVDVDDNGGFFASGAAAPGGRIRLALNGAPVATVTAGEDGRWSLKVERGMNAGAYRVSAEQVDEAGKVLAQTEVPFDYPGRRQQVASAPSAPAEATSANAVVPDLQSVTVQRGDSLWRISQRMFGSGMRYTQIYAANNGQIRNPSLIFPNQILVVPPKP